MAACIMIVDEDYPAGSGIIEPFPEAIDVAQNGPLWRMMSLFGTMHSHWCMTEMNESVPLP